MCIRLVQRVVACGHLACRDSAFGTPNAFFPAAQYALVLPPIREGRISLFPCVDIARNRYKINQFPFPQVLFCVGDHFEGTSSRRGVDSKSYRSDLFARVCVGTPGFNRADRLRLYIPVLVVRQGNLLSRMKFFSFCCLLFILWTIRK
jgi:hypothetical protein